jgi:hypothetical protein
MSLKSVSVSSRVSPEFKQLLLFAAEKDNRSQSNSLKPFFFCIANSVLFAVH